MLDRNHMQKTRHSGEAIGEAFGTTADGTNVRRVKISGSGLTAHVMTWGAVIQDLHLEGHVPSLVLGFESFDPYPLHSPHFGAVAGRCANRIGEGRFTLDGTTRQLDRNFLGKHHLHGGSKGFGKRVWEFIDHGPDFVTLQIAAVDGDMGYPGNLIARCTYRLQGGALACHFEAETDAPTLCNFVQHSYFNLDDGGATDIFDHSLEIAAQTYLPVDAEMIPTGEERPVAGTDFDFRAMRPVRRERDGSRVAYDHNFCVSRERMPHPRTVVRAAGARSGITMEVSTTEPGVQFYDGYKLDIAVPGLDGTNYRSGSGFCLEPQVWPDAPNHADYPSAVLRPGETYRQITEYRFAKA
jgi:aldose 1-epimerase